MPTRLPRPALVARVVDHGGPVVVVAPRGFGKTTLLSVLRLHERYSPGPSVPWLPDGCELVIGPGFGTPPSMAAMVSERFPVVIASRTGVGLEALLEHPDVLRLDQDDLVFDLAETTQLAREHFREQVASQVGRVLLPATGGWPALVAAHLDGLSQLNPLESEVTGRLAERVARNETLAAVLRPVLREFSKDEIVQLATLAHVKTFPEESAIAAAGSEFLERCTRLGLPLVATPDGRLEFLPMVGAYLRSRSAPDHTTVKRMIPALLACDAAMHAIRLLIGIGELDEAALIVKDMSRRDLEATDPMEMLGALSMLESVVHEWPELRLQQARNLRRLGRVAEARAVLERSLQAALPQELRWEIEAESCFQMANEAGSDELLGRIDSFLASVPMSELATRTTFLTARGVCLASSLDLDQIRESEHVFLMATKQWESLGDVSFAARTLRLFAATTLSELCRFADVRRVVERSAQMMPGQAASRVMVLNLLSRTSAIAGDLEAFDVYDSELEALVDGQSVDWLKGYLHWFRMHAASWRQDADAVAVHYRKADHLIECFRAERTGAAFQAEAAEAHARVGLLDRAQELLDAVREHPFHNTRMVTMAAVAISAASGAREDARELVDRALTSEGIPQSLRWRMLFHLATAEFKHSGFVDPQLLQLIELEADVVGEATWPRRLQPQFWSRGQTQVPTEADSAPPAGMIDAIAIDILGGFTVRSGDTLMALSSGHVTTLVKLMAVRRGCVPVEVAIDLLWPEADMETGRRRLKNVISRLRKELGERSITRSDQSIAFGINVRLDVNEFDQRARNAMVLSASHSPDAVAAAVAAMDVYRGALLPMDLYDDWVEEARTFFRARAASLLGLIRSAVPSDLQPWLAATTLRISGSAFGLPAG
jgi:hypothetical protein